MSAIDNAYSPRIDMIQAQNEMFTIWLLHKVYCRLLSGFVCPLQLIEEDDIGKN